MTLRLRTAAPKRGRRGPTPPSPVDAALLRRTPPFSALDAPLLEQLAPRVERLTLARGEALFDGPPVEDAESPVLLLLSGDVAVWRTERGGEEAVHNYLAPGELYVQRSLADERTDRLRLAALCPVEALRLRYADLNQLLRRVGGFRAAFGEAVQPVSERQVRHFDDRFSREVARFLVEQRLTFAGRVKLKRMDLCIECDGCYDACRARHGTDRLGASEVRFGLAEIPQNCHNCEVPECLDKCKFGYIRRDPRSGEIRIADDCTGCTLCARGCSFGSIRMHPLAEIDVARYLRGRSSAAKGKNIAQKCDNCVDHADQACITACPVGALVEVEGGQLFDRWRQFSPVGAAGAGQAVEPARRWAWVGPVALLLNLVGLSWICWGRGELDPRAAASLSHALGYGAAGLLLAAQLYRVGKAWAPRLGSLPAWMEAHVWLGILGGLYGALHGGLRLGDPAAAGTSLLMLVALLTGAAGRYLIRLVPRSRTGRQLELAEVDAAIAEVERALEEAFTDQGRGMTLLTQLDRAGLGHRRAPPTDHPEELLEGVRRLFAEARADGAYIDSMRAELAGVVGPERLDAAVVKLKRRARLQRSLARHVLLSRLLRRYRRVHVVSGDLLFAALAVHVVLALMYRVGR